VGTADTQTPARRATYLGVFLVALATLMLEILLTRITSVSAWYHLAFFVISLGMLGMTAGAVFVFLLPDRFDDADIPTRLAQSALGFAASIPPCVAIALSMPIGAVVDFMSFVGLLAIGIVLALPFILGGITLTLALTRAGLPPGIVYGVDLTGAALGCALVIPVLDTVDAPSAALFAAAFAALGAGAFARAAGRAGKRAGLLALALLGLTFGNASADIPTLRPAWVKGLPEDPSGFAYSEWNTYSRVTVTKEEFKPPAFWGKGRHTPPGALAPIKQRFIMIDGAAGTTMPFIGEGPQAHDYLAWDVTAFAHQIRPDGPAAVIGVGGGRDVLEAARVGHDPVVGVELNDLIVGLHEEVMADYTGIAALPQVELVLDEARSYMARERRQFEVITMSLIDTWASTGAGAYALSENGLYTREAWNTFLDRLTDDGIFTVSRWYVVGSPGETARMLALAMETIYARDVETHPRAHIVLLQTELVSTLLLSPSPFRGEDLKRIEEVAVARGFNMIATPRKLPAHPMLRELLQQPTRADLWRWTSEQEFDLTPPTDARPFFFNMLKPSTWLHDRDEVEAKDLAFLGNLRATQTLLHGTVVSLLLTLLTLAWPMAKRWRDLGAFGRGDVFASLAYFALIGLGFMLVEMALLSRLNVFLGHPILALAVLLGGIIFFTGIGSMLSERIDPSRKPWTVLYPLIPATLVLGAGFGMLPVMHGFAAAATPTRVLLSVALIAPPALGLGLCFPLGLKLVERMEAAHPKLPGTRRATLGPWLWGVNGAFGVCASGLGLGVSMVWGIQTTLLVGAACYFLLPLLTRRLARAG
jgi:spermidine synthase